jgi:hypothetical protein
MIHNRLVPDAEVASVLIALAPLDSRLDRYRQRLLSRREFDVEECLDNGWSSGERVLIQFAGVLWHGGGTCDLGYIVTMLDGEFFQAAMDAIAARRQADLHTDAAAAFGQALQVPA